MFGTPQGMMGLVPCLPNTFNDWEMEVVERFLLFLQNRKIRPFQEDRLILKETRLDGFSVILMYRKLMHSLPTDFPWHSIWNPIVPPKLGFFAWEASWGKEREGIPLVNRCFLCEEEEETIDHLLIHCSRAKMLWNLFFAMRSVFKCITDE